MYFFKRPYSINFQSYGSEQLAWRRFYNSKSVFEIFIYLYEVKKHKIISLCNDQLLYEVTVSFTNYFIFILLKILLHNKGNRVIKSFANVIILASMFFLNLLSNTFEYLNGFSTLFRMFSKSNKSMEIYITWYCLTVILFTAFKCRDVGLQQPTPNIGFSKVSSTTSLYFSNTIIRLIHFSWF